MIIYSMTVLVPCFNFTPLGCSLFLKKKKIGGRRAGWLSRCFQRKKKRGRNSSVLLTFSAFVAVFGLVFRLAWSSRVACFWSRDSRDQLIPADCERRLLCGDSVCCRPLAVGQYAQQLALSLMASTRLTNEWPDDWVCEIRGNWKLRRCRNGNLKASEVSIFDWLPLDISAVESPSGS